jgi:glycosyltransferase involved in cell wall biosynthesis
VAPPDRVITYGLDATPLLGRRTGIGRYVAEIADGVLAGLAANERLVVYAGTFRQNPLLGVSHEPLTRLAKDPRVSVRRQWTPLSAAHAVWNRADFPPLEWVTGRLDVFHGTNFRLPPLAKGRGVVTVHDLAFLTCPGSVPPEVGRRLENAVRAAVRRATHVIADSEHTKGDVVRLLGADPARVTTIHLAAGGAFRTPKDRDADRARLAKRYGLRFPFVLYVGTTNPRKNLARLLDAFAAARRRASLPHSLVLVGDAGFAHGAVLERIERLGLNDAVVLPGFTDDADMPAIYGAADLLAFPSLYEGFGLPVLEAMSCGCPVLTSSASSLPEVAGDAAVLVDPESADAIAAGLERVLTDAAFRTRLVDAGLRRAVAFSWSRAAAEHLALYREVAG